MLLVASADLAGWEVLILFATPRTTLLCRLPDMPRPHVCRVRVPCIGRSTRCAVPDPGSDRESIRGPSDSSSGGAPPRSVGVSVFIIIATAEASVPASPTGAGAAASCSRHAVRCWISLLDTASQRRKRLPAIAPDMSRMGGVRVMGTPAHGLVLVLRPSGRLVCAADGPSHAPTTVAPGA